MRRALVKVHDIEAGILTEQALNHYQFTYNENYSGEPVSMTMPLSQRSYQFDRFPPFFDGLLPEGIMLEALLRTNKINEDDYFSQLLLVGKDVVGACTIEALP